MTLARPMKLKIIISFALLASSLLANSTVSIVDSPTDSRAAIKPNETTVYLNGDVVTMNTAQPSAEAVAVRDGKILAVGQLADVVIAAGKGARTIDLERRTLLPGFIDSHGHFGLSALYLAFENLAAPPIGPVKNITDIQEILKTKKSSSRKGEWILGRGYDEAYLEEGRHPSKFDLDKISTEHPIALLHVSAHFISCNSKCLEIAGIHAETKNPQGGIIQRVPGSREPNGVLEEQALSKVLPFLPLKDTKKLLALISRTQDHYASFGITTVQDGASTVSDLQLFDQAASQGLFKLDLIAYPTYRSTDLLDNQFAPSLVYKNNWRVGGVKLSLDGSPQGKTAYLSSPYFIAPAGQDDTYLGYPTMPQAEVNNYIDRFYAKNWQTLVHANGDAAAQQMIDAVALAQKKHGKGDRRTTMIHAQTVREDQLSRMQFLQIIPSYFASHTYFWGDWHRDSVLGQSRAARISPLKSTLNRNMVYTLHNDAPVVPPDMLHLVWSATNRVTRSGKVLGPEQRITVWDALMGITLHAAYQNFEEQIKGSIEPGKTADLVILSANPLSVEPMIIKDIQVIETIKAGVPIYQK